MSTFALVLQLWITLRTALHPPKFRGMGDQVANALVSYNFSSFRAYAHLTSMLAQLLLMPYVGWLGFIIVILVVCFRLSIRATEP